MLCVLAVSGALSPWGTLASENTVSGKTPMPSPVRGLPQFGGPPVAKLSIENGRSLSESTQCVASGCVECADPSTGSSWSIGGTYRTCGWIAQYGYCSAAPGIIASCPLACGSPSCSCSDSCTATAPPLCGNTCFYLSDGDCDDGGPGAEDSTRAPPRSVRR